MHSLNLLNTNLLELIRDFAEEEHKREDGVKLPISLVGVDSGYLADTIYNLCKVNPTKFIPTKGLSTRGKPVIKVPNMPNQNRVFLGNIGTDTGKDIVASRMRLDIPGPGYIEFADRSEFNEDFFKSLTSNIKKTVYRSGKSQEQWVLPSGRHDEALDCFVINLAMVRLLQERYNVDLNEEEDPEQKEDDKRDHIAMIQKLAEAARQ